MHILDKIQETIAVPREDYKPHVPRIQTMTIPKEMIGAVIGTGGKIIQEIQLRTHTIITIEEKDGIGYIEVAAPDKEAIEAAMEIIQGICAVPEVGLTYNGKVVSILAFGAFVEILPGKEGLLHISEISFQRVENVEDVLKVGEMIDVKLIEIDEKSGKYRLSRKALLEKPEGYVEPAPFDRGPRGPRDDRGGRDSRDRRDDRGGRPPRRDYDRR